MNGRGIRKPFRSVPLELRAREPCGQVLEHGEEFHKVSSWGQSFTEYIGALLRDRQELVSFRQFYPIDNLYNGRPNGSVIINGSLSQE